ncbi:unnamed protein product [Ilex paraguariensis]|uniref:DDE Tnp4 domain-containing protein n=1 Tax=Ilex paraguariensis TaxID=185542 RepID=A0ABC8TNN3_9AQUA
MINESGSRVVLEPAEDKPRYRSRTVDIATNVLGVRSQDMGFIYVLPGWEGSATDGRVLRDVMIRRNELVVNRGTYYLVDGGYTNGQRFFAPFRGQMYHLKKWRDGHQPRTLDEFFNMKHYSARNVIEICFGLLKKRWAILRSPSFYPIKIQNRIIIVCCLLHNYMRDQMQIDPIEVEVDATGLVVENNAHDDHITSVETSNEWLTFRLNLTNKMFDEWRASRQRV